MGRPVKDDRIVKGPFHWEREADTMWRAESDGVFLVAVFSNAKWQWYVEREAYEDVVGFGYSLDLDEAKDEAERFITGKMISSFKPVSAK
jgi:hypothetical protein